jgi:bleomycin hydrolase
MKKALLALMLGCSIAVSAQTTETNTEAKEGVQFTTIKEVPVTPIKDQLRSSTCWSFSSVGLL